MKSRDKIVNYLTCFSKTLGIKKKNFKEFMWDEISKKNLQYWECIDAVLYATDNGLLTAKEGMTVIEAIEYYDGFTVCKDFDKYIKLIKELKEKEFDAETIISILEEMYFVGLIDKDVLIGLSLELDIFIEIPEDENLEELQ